MQFTPQKINTFLLFKLPSAWLCGVRVKEIDSQQCLVTVRHRWINQNPFKSMFWAVQGMAAELSTGAIVMREVANCKHPVSMLVISSKAEFKKKARGKIVFTCIDVAIAQQAIAETIASGEGKTFLMSALGVDSFGDLVSEFTFEWTVKLKQKV